MMNRREMMKASAKAIPAFMIAGTAPAAAISPRPRTSVRCGRMLVSSGAGYAAYLVDWEDRHAFANEVLGLAGGKPQEHPDDPARFAISVRIRGCDPLDIDPLNLRYACAVVHIGYGAPR